MGVGNRKKKKYTSGEAVRYISRKQALKKLQLTLKDFRRVCILKGIYPREPRNRVRAQQGASGIKTLYHTKDIKFLLHEPIIWKIRELKVLQTKIRKVKAMNDWAPVLRNDGNLPRLKIDHLVKERYPTFIDALRDLDDCLTLCFLFSTFPSLSRIPRDNSLLCRRLTVEFMHAVIAQKALRKVFISVKGYYYQAEIEGQLVNWIVPHGFGFQPQTTAEVDFKIMSTFVDFYIMLLGFVNFKMFHSMNLCYPPKLTVPATHKSDKELVDERAYSAERVAAMNISLVKVQGAPEAEDESALDSFPSEGDPRRVEAEKITKLKNLFKGMKFFLNREVPREPLVFVIRCFGGEVSWDKLSFVGSTFEETDETINYQIVDRPTMASQYISRHYVQPQWVFDSVNAAALLPVNKYLIGAVLPPHLSPFSDSRKDQDQIYIPPEARALNDPEGQPMEEKSSDESDSEIESDEDQSAGEPEEDDQTLEQESEEEEEEDEEEEDEETKQLKAVKKKNMAVKPGVTHKDNPYQAQLEDKQAFILREKLVRNKHRKLYKSMKEGKERRAKEIWLLRKKRRKHDEDAKKEKKQQKKNTKLQTAGTN